MISPSREPVAVSISNELRRTLNPLTNNDLPSLRRWICEAVRLAAQRPKALAHFIRLAKVTHRGDMGRETIWLTGDNLEAMHALWVRFEPTSKSRIVRAAIMLRLYGPQPTTMETALVAAREMSTKARAEFAYREKLARRMIDLPEIPKPARLEPIADLAMLTGCDPWVILCVLVDSMETNEARKTESENPTDD